MLHDRRTPINTRQFQLFMELSMQVMDDEALGSFSRPLWWGSYGLLARATVSITEPCFPPRFNRAA